MQGSPNDVAESTKSRAEHHLGTGWLTRSIWPDVSSSAAAAGKSIKTPLGKLAGHQHFLVTRISFSATSADFLI